jgi:YD repeat-containing protein
VQAGLPETFSATVFDGMGRVRGTSADNPNSAGGYRGQSTQYDLMGRPFKQSNPTEMTLQWAVTGDDAGWVWTEQKYDWKGRPTLTTLPSINGGQSSPTRELSYGGCGCAGGDVVTVRDEVGRKQRMTSDILGRAWKTEVLQWNGSDYVVYSTVTTNYNARDQVTSVVEQGVGGASQTTTLPYDGHGRLKTQQTPSQTAATQYAYNSDDLISQVTDGRGVVSTFSYNNRHLVTGISYTSPTGIASILPVSFTYDAVGNRTSMTDSSGSVTYSYDQLSRKISETRQFADLSGSYALSYGYNLANEVTSITDPAGAVVNYSYDKTGRMTDVTGTSFAGITQYATNMRYRAWGDLKSASFGDSSSLTANYNSQLLPTDFAISGLISKHYEYNEDGRLRYSRNNAGDRFDRSYTYDHMGRMTEAFSGPAARGQADTDIRPYMMYYEYDQMSHLTSRGGRLWSGPAPGDGGSYVNDRNIYWQYDADGRLVSSGETAYSYDAAGRAANIVGQDGDLTQAQVFDGDGVRTKLHSQQITHNENGTTTTETKTQYFVTSSLLNSVVTELDENGQKTRTFVYQGDQILAWQQKNGSTETMGWEHRDVSNATVRGAAVAELEPMGSNAGLMNPFPLTSTRPPLAEVRTYPGFGGIGGGQCQLDYIDTPCDIVHDLMEAGATNNESLIHDNKKGWRREQYEVRPFGLGLFVTESPVVRGINDEEGPYWDTEEQIFSHPQNTSQPPSEELIHCDEDVKKAIEKISRDAIMARAGGGTTGREYGFKIDSNGNGGYKPGPIQTNYAGREVTIPDIIKNLTVARVHTHPLDDIYPSAGDIRNSKKTGTVVYVVSNRGLYLFNPKNPTDASGNNRIVKATKCPPKVKSGP